MKQTQKKQTETICSTNENLNNYGLPICQINKWFNVKQIKNEISIELIARKKDK